MGLIKIFSGNETLALNLQSEIEKIDVKTVIKNNKQATKMNHDNSVAEIFINEIDYGKISAIIEDFRMSI